MILDTTESKELSRTDDRNLSGLHMNGEGAEQDTDTDEQGIRASRTGDRTEHPRCASSESASPARSLGRMLETFRLSRRCDIDAAR